MPGDTVSFKYRRRTQTGTITRTNPKRAVILAEGQEFTVPYELLTAKDGESTLRESKLDSIQQLALHLIKEHRLRRWKFKFDHSVRRAGCCDYRKKQISISINLALTASDEDIRDTLLHEIAHALVGKKHNHDAIWKAKAKEIGCTGERTHKLQLTPPRYRVTCENKCWESTAERKNSRLICKKCGKHLVYYEHLSSTLKLPAQ